MKMLQMKDKYDTWEEYISDYNRLYAGKVKENVEKDVALGLIEQEVTRECIIESLLMNAKRGTSTEDYLMVPDEMRLK